MSTDNRPNILTPAGTTIIGTAEWALGSETPGGNSLVIGGGEIEMDDSESFKDSSGRYVYADNKGNYWVDVSTNSARECWAPVDIDSPRVSKPWLPYTLGLLPAGAVFKVGLLDSETHVYEPGADSVKAWGVCDDDEVYVQGDPLAAQPAPVTTDHRLSTAELLYLAGQLRDVCRKLGSAHLVDLTPDDLDSLSGRIETIANKLDPLVAFSEKLELQRAWSEDQRHVDSRGPGTGAVPLIQHLDTWELQVHDEFVEAAERSGVADFEVEVVLAKIETLEGDDLVATFEVTMSGRARLSPASTRDCMIDLFGDTPETTGVAGIANCIIIED